jgi:transcriptional regulator with XRE-family HTH domain
MSREVVAQRSGVSLSTVNRALSGDCDGASVAKVCAIAAALGVALKMEEELDPTAFQEREAEKKARKLVGLVQGTMGLEAQGVSPRERDQMIRRTLHELMAGPKRRLWEE